MNNNQKHNLTHQLTHELGLAIIKGDYPIGTGLPSEAELCLQFNVSRSATREAVKMLSAKGLITSRPKQGIQVLNEASWNMFDPDVLHWILHSKPSLTLLKEFMQMLAAIEPQAAALAASQATAQQLDNITQAFTRLQEADNGLDDPLEAEVAFRSEILMASGNRFIAQFNNFLDTASRIYTRFSHRLVLPAEQASTLSQQILTAIQLRDVESARQAATSSLQLKLDALNTLSS